MTRLFCMPVDLRFPNRLEKVRKTGLAITQTIGWFTNYGTFRLKMASLEDFQFTLFTPFNQPALGGNLDTRRARLFLHGLTISRAGITLLVMEWDNATAYYHKVRRLSKDHWDRTLCEFWEAFKPPDLSQPRTV